MNPTLDLTHVGVAGVAVISLFTGIVLTLMGATAGTDWRAFLDRPICWIVGHPAPGSRYLVPTIHEGRAADVWRCRRCKHTVTVLR